MFSKKISEVRNPIVYIFLTMIISSTYYGLNDDFKKLAVFIAGFFFVSILYYCGASFTGVLSIFFIAGICLNIMYYSVPEEVNGKIDISKVTNYNITGVYEGKKFLIESKEGNFQQGNQYYISGKVLREQDKSKGIAGTIQCTKSEKLPGDFINKIQGIRKRIYEMLEENLGSRKASLISSIAFGYSDYLDEEDKEDMKKFGIIHSISVSGLHVVIVYGFLRVIAGRKLGLLGVLLYVIFTGCSYSSIRAFIMLAAIEMGKILKRNNNSLSALCLSGIILLMNKPYSIFEVSFDLSYLATIGIILYNKNLNNLLYKLPGKLREAVSITLCAQIFTFPYLVCIFRDFSINFILGNIVLVPLVNVIVISGNILPLVYVFPKAFDFISYINLKILDLFDWSIDKLENFTLPVMYGNEYMVSFYLFMIIGMYYYLKGHKRIVFLAGIYVLVMAVQIYSPILRIRYYNEGAIAVSYRGERAAMSNKSEIDMDSICKSAMADKSFRKENLIRIKDICSIKSKGEDYILDTNGKKYLLKMTWSKKSDKEYDIINFKDGAANSIFIIGGKVFSSCV